MKIFTLSFFLVLAGFAAVAQDTLPNPGFENWIQDGATYRDPVGWNTPNALIGGFGKITCLQDSSIVHSGKYSCRLVTLYFSLAGGNVPGTITTGVIPTSQGGSITGGVEINSRPKSVSGWYQYLPAGADTAGVTIAVTKGDSIFGTGGFNFTDSVTTWTPFSFNINYTSASTPDTSLITFVSSINAGIANSSLWVDDVSYSYYAAGIDEVSNSPINLYPNPANREINIDNQTMQASSLNLTTTTGQLVKEVKMHAGVNIVDVSSLSAGVYILNGVGANGTTYKTSVVIDK